MQLCLQQYMLDKSHNPGLSPFAMHSNAVGCIPQPASYHRALTTSTCVCPAACFLCRCGASLDTTFAYMYVLKDRPSCQQCTTSCALCVFTIISTQCIMPWPVAQKQQVAICKQDIFGILCQWVWLSVCAFCRYKSTSSCTASCVCARHTSSLAFLSWR